jgi:O-acetyl-ADP-ribose deacetylase
VRGPKTTQLGDTRPDQYSVCPRGCGFHAAAVRVMSYRTTWSGRVISSQRFEFAAPQCPNCGTALAEACPECAKPIAQPTDVYCRFCGRPVPWGVERARNQSRSVGRRWRAVATEFPAAGASLWLLSGDLTALAVDAIVSSDDHSGRMQADTAFAIKRLAGSEVEDESVSNGPYREGMAWITEAGSLGVKRIVHVRATMQNGVASVQLVRLSVQNALALAVLHELGSIAFPALGSGSGRLSVPVSAVAIATEVRAFLDEASNKCDVVLVIYNEADVDEIREQLTSQLGWEPRV